MLNPIYFDLESNVKAFSRSFSRGEKESLFKRQARYKISLITCRLSKVQMVSNAINFNRLISIRFYWISIRFSIGFLFEFYWIPVINRSKAC